MKKSQWQIVKKIGSYMDGYYFYGGCSIIIAGVNACLLLFIPKLIGEAIDKLPGEYAQVVKILWIIGLLSVLSMIAQWLLSICSQKLIYTLVRDLRQVAFSKILKLPISYLDTHSHGDIESRVMADVDQMADGLLLGVTQLFSGIVTLVGTFICMLTINRIMTAVVVLLTPFSILIAAYLAKYSYHLFYRQMQERGNQTAFVGEMIEGIRVIQAFGQTDQVLETFSKGNDKLAQDSLKALFFSSLTNPATRFVNGIVYTAVGCTGAFSALYGMVTIGQLSAFLGYALQYSKPFNEISSVVSELQQSLACAQRLFDLLDEPEIVEPVASRKQQSFSSRGEVEFKHVYFSYDQTQPLLEDFSLKISSGQRVAIVGETGSGKTTLLNLLLRFYDVDKGAIMLDGKDIRLMNRSDVRQHFGMVLQDTWLKSGTVRENIKMGNPHLSDQELKRIAAICHLDHFVNQLPQGYDTLISDKTDFSQGQRQLLSIARMMSSDPSIVLLDEATSSIDTRTEMKIQAAFSHLMKDKTSFIVAHRLSTIKNADLILVLKKGKIAEMGTHSSLLEKKGEYARLYQSQWERNENKNETTSS